MPFGSQGAIKLAPTMVPVEEGMPTGASTALVNGGTRITPVVPASVPAAPEMRR